MAFERYIRRHGKKLGPYYYENVRSHDGKVKTIYLGTNPHNHPKHRIRKPLFFLIIVLTLILLLGGSLFFLQNKAYLIQSAKQEPDFDVDQILLKVLIRSHESLEKQVRVMNIGDDPAGVDIVEFGLEDIAKIDSSSFVLKPGQTKVVGINFSSFAPEQKTEQQPGIYVGKLVVKSEKASKEIPMVAEIETKNVLFDMNLNPVAIERRVMQGSDVTIEVKIYNLQSIESSSVDVDYFVKDISGNTILTESETVVVTTQASFFKTISIPRNLKPGPYVFASRTRFGDSIGTASYLFEVIGPEAESSFVQFCKNSVLCLGLSLATILLLFALTAYFYFFIGAYLYEKLTGRVALPAKEKEKTEIVKPSIFERIKAKISEWREESEAIRKEEEKLRKEEEAKRQKETEAKRREDEVRIKQEQQRRQEESRNEEEMRRIAEERKHKLKEKIAEPSRRLKKFYMVLADAKKAIDDKDVSKVNKIYAEERDLYVSLSNREKHEIYGKLMELYKQRNDFIESTKLHEESKKKDEEKRQKELEKQRAEEKREGEKEELRNQKALEKQKAAEETKKKLKEFFHKIGLYKSPEEKKRIALQKESKRREKLRAEERLRKQEEAEKQDIAEKNRKELERQKENEAKRREDEVRIKQEQQRRQEKSREDAELQIQRAEEERAKREEEIKRKKDGEKRQKEIDGQRKEQIKAQKLERIKELEARLDKNREAERQLNSELAKLESEKKVLSEKIDAPDTGIKNIDDEISGRTAQIKELSIQKSSLAEKRKTQIDDLEKNHESEKNAEQAKIKEMKAELAARQNAMMQELEKELSGLPDDKRKKIEKWKRLEIKAKLKLEEHNLEEEIEGHESRAAEEKSRIVEDYKKSLRETNKKQIILNKEIEDLQNRKQQILLEAEDAKKELLQKENETQKTRQKLGSLMRERQQIESELSRLKAELKPWDLLGTLMSKYREKTQKIQERRKEKQEKKEAIEAAERVREGLKKKGPREKIAVEEKKPAAEDRLKLLEQEIEKEESKEKPVKEIKPGLFERLFARKPKFRLKRAEEAHEEEMPAPEKKTGLFGGLIGRLEKKEAAKEIKRKKPAEQEKKPESEAEELEEAIRSLGLFKEIEKEVGGKEEAPKKKHGMLSELLKKMAPKKEPEEIPEKKPGIFGKLLGMEKPAGKLPSKESPEEAGEKKTISGSRNLMKFHKAFSDAKGAIAGNDISKAKKLYADARNIYVGLENKEKKEVYDGLMELYSKLSG